MLLQRYAAPLISRIGDVVVGGRKKYIKISTKGFAPPSSLTGMIFKCEALLGLGNSARRTDTRTY